MKRQNAGVPDISAMVVTIDQSWPCRTRDTGDLADMQTNRDGIWIIDADGRTTYANERIAEILRTSCSEMIGNPSFAYVYPEDAVAAQRLFDVKKDGNATAFRFRLRCKD